MIVSRLELTDFRNYANAEFDLTAGTTAVIGDNGQGKTNLAEALAYLATLSSFRGAPGDALVRVGADQAIIRATVTHDDGPHLKPPGFPGVRCLGTALNRLLPTAKTGR